MPSGNFLFLEATQRKTVRTAVESLRDDPGAVEVQVVGIAARSGRRPAVPVAADDTQATETAGTHSVAVARGRGRVTSAMNHQFVLGRGAARHANRVASTPNRGRAMLCITTGSAQNSAEIFLGRPLFVSYSRLEETGGRRHPTAEGQCRSARESSSESPPPHAARATFHYVHSARPLTATRFGLKITSDRHISQPNSLHPRAWAIHSISPSAK